MHNFLQIQQVHKTLNNRKQHFQACKIQFEVHAYACVAVALAPFASSELISW
jgi:hypothetical protein